ncbi:MAG: vWA domain-containing protein [Steroidobacteraceae bacterium]
MFELLFTHPVWAYRNGSLRLASGAPLWLLAALISAAVALVAFTLARREFLPLAQRVTLGVLQSTLLALLLVLLWRPVLQVERVRERENVLAVALDASASMAHGQSGQSRLQEAVTALQAGPLTELARSFEVRLFSFADAAAPLADFQQVPAPGAQTRIGDSLLTILQTASSVPLAGVLLVSDGAENGASLTEERLAQIAAYGVPIHTLGVGAETGSNDLELESVRLGSSAPPHSRVAAELAIRYDAAQPEATVDTEVRVYDGETLIAAKKLHLIAGRTNNVTVEVPTGDSGVRDMRFALDTLPQERNVINNARRHLLSVPAARRNVLYFDAEPRWEYKFIRRAAELDRGLRLASLVKTTQNKFYRQGVTSSAELSDGFPKDAASLFAYDAVILGNVPATTLTGEQHELLARFVDQRGGGLLLLAGRNALGAGGWSTSALMPLLPTHLPERSAGTFTAGNAQTQLTVYGEQSLVTRLDQEGAQNAKLWQTLPALADTQSLGRLKPGAVVLLESLAAQRRAPLLVWQRYGRGAVWMLGTASTLRWQMRSPAEDQRHELFWRQLLHGLADAAPSAVALSSDRSIFDDEPRVQIEAVLRNARYEPIANATPTLTVLPPQSGEPIALPMQASPEADGRYTATLDAPAAGLYRVDLATPNGNAQIQVRRENGVAEHFATRQNRAVLERLAAMTGGRYWTLATLPAVTGAIPYSRAGIIERQTLDLWSVPAVFVLLLLLKGTEWLLRLKWGRL